MNPIEQVRVFQRVAELASFTRAADDLGLPKATVSNAVSQMEALLGVRLLHRTTRKVQLTPDGQAFHERSQVWLADFDELQTMFQRPGSAGLKGRVRIDMSTGLARQVVLPRLPALLEAHPGLVVELSSTERRVDLVREGFDCVVRAGPLLEPGLVARPLGQLHLLNCASPAYLAVHGTPDGLDDLARGHRLVHFASQLGTRPTGFEYLERGQLRSRPMPGALTVNNADAYTAACLAGLGIVQVPAVAVRALIASGALLEVLPAHRAPPLPLNLLYPSRRHLALRVRVVMDWLAEVVQAHLRDAG